MKSRQKSRMDSSIENYPIAPNDTEAGRLQNRRVQIIITKGQSELRNARIIRRQNSLLDFGHVKKT